MNLKLSTLGEKYNELQLQIDSVNDSSLYYESLYYKYDGVECYIEEINLFHEYVVLRVNDEDSYRFSDNNKTKRITLMEFDQNAKIINV